MSIQYYLELVGTLVFAISGALAVKDENRDWLAAGFTGFITAIGGGSLRDVLLGSYPLAWVEDVWILYTILIGVALAFLFTEFLEKLRKTMFLFDTIGIGLFAIIGTEKALSLGVRPEVAAIMGMFSAVMGGVLRDTFTNKTPVILQKEIYASACLGGGIVYLILDHLEIDRNLNMIISIALIIGIRLLAVKFNLALPGFDRKSKT